MLLQILTETVHFFSNFLSFDIFLCTWVEFFENNNLKLYFAPFIEYRKIKFTKLKEESDSGFVIV
jgi:hypothetical protein